MSRDVFITRTASFLPLAPVDNDRMESVLGMANNRPSRSRRITLRSNGIASRHYVIDPESGVARYTNAQLTAEAVRRLAAGTFDLADLACLSTGTSVPDQILPGHGVMVHGELGTGPCEVITTAGVCAAGATALKYAWLAVRSGDSANAIATGSEAVSLTLRATHYAAETDQGVADLQSRPELAFEKDFLRWMLSDAAGAVLLQPAPSASGPSLRVDWIDIASFAHEQPACMYAGAEKNDRGGLVGWAHFSHEEIARRSVLAIKQDVKQLNAHIIEYCFDRHLAAVRVRRGLAPESIDWFLPHMSSEYFRPRIAEALVRIGLPIPGGRWFTNLATCGNTGSASFYVMLDELWRSGRLRPGQRLLAFVPESGRFTSAYLHFTVV